MSIATIDRLADMYHDRLLKEWQDEEAEEDKKEARQKQVKQKQLNQQEKRHKLAEYRL